MGGKHQNKARDYAVGERLLALRMRAVLRQAELAALLPVSQRTIHISEFVFHCYSYLIQQEVSSYEQHVE